MNAMELLATRASNGKLGEPAPDDDVLDAILEAALRAPDHAMLRPWKVLVLRGESLERLGRIFADATRADGADVSESELERAARKPLRAPLMVIVAATPREHPKVPEIEQVLSAGALAHGVLLGLHAAGFSALWRTGPHAYSAMVKSELGLRAEDHIVGFLYVGTPTLAAPEMARPKLAEHVERW